MITAGMNYRPDFVPGSPAQPQLLSRNRIEDEIGSLPAGVILSNCYSQNSPTSCGLIVRNADTKLISHIIQTNANVGETETAGVDLEAAYNGNTSWGILSARLDANLLIQYDQFIPAAGGTESDQGHRILRRGRFFPDGATVASLDLKWRRASAGFTWDYIGGFVECEDNDCKGLYRSDVNADTGLQGC